MPSELELVARLALGTLIGGLIGAERELSDQPAGFRTHALVGLGAALFSIVSAFGYQAIAGQGPQAVVRADVTRVASQIVVGIGFLGGGAILKYGVSIRGLTTAATLWTTAAIGTAIGLGSFTVALAASALALVVIVGFRPIRRLLRRWSANTGQLVVETMNGLRVGEILATIERVGARVSSIRVDDNDDGHIVRVFLRLPPQATASSITDALAEHRDVASVGWGRA